MYDVVYFSNISENTKRFVDKLGVTAFRIPVLRNEVDLTVARPFVLITPTYGSSDTDSGVPKQVIRFLNDVENRKLLRGVVAAGNTNFGEKYGIAGALVAKKCSVPLLYRFELLGTPQDVLIVKKRMEDLWKLSN